MLSKLNSRNIMNGIVFKDKKESKNKSFFGKGNSSNPNAHSETDNLYQKGIATLRDLIAPPAIKLGPNSMQIGATLSRTYFVIAYPRYLSTNWFSPIINIDFGMDIAFSPLLQRVFEEVENNI